jgi:hypothetical protein
MLFSSGEKQVVNSLDKRDSHAASNGVEHMSRLRGLFSLFVSPSILLLLLIIQGCGPRIYTYPEEWPSSAIAAERGCQDIAGTYRNSGSSSENMADVYLFDTITNEGIFGTHECTYCVVTLAWSDSELSELLVTLRYAGGGPIIEQVVLKRDEGDFACESGAISTEYVTGFEAYVEGYIESGTRKFFMADDGSLILKENATVMGHMLVVIPGGWTQTIYSRWLRQD